MVPLAKTGGLADSTAGLAKHLARSGHEVSCFLPFYTLIREKGFQTKDCGVELAVRIGGRSVQGRILRLWCRELPLDVYTVANEHYFSRTHLYGGRGGEYEDNAYRFAFFSRAVLVAIDQLGLHPHVIHCHDWHSALVPVYMAELYPDAPARTATVMTVHNIAYQGVFPPDVLPRIGLGRHLYDWRNLEFYGKVNFLKGGLVFSDLITTVSRAYAKQIRTAQFGAGLAGVLQQRRREVFGILNGVDYDEWNPETDPHIAANYTTEELSGKSICKADLSRRCGFPIKPEPLLVFVGRLVSEKGIELLLAIVPRLKEIGARLVVLGVGEQRYHEALERAARMYPELRPWLTFDNELAHRVLAGSDMLLMPSIHEPCGLTQLYALRYGTIPVVRKTGGLRQTVKQVTGTNLSRGQGTGFAFERPTPRALLTALRKAIRWFDDRVAWRSLMQNAMAEDWSWKRSVRKYLEVYRKALQSLGTRERHQPALPP